MAVLTFPDSWEQLKKKFPVSEHTDMSVMSFGISTTCVPLLNCLPCCHCSVQEQLGEITVW